jgi:hypothetical protein
MATPHQPRDQKGWQQMVTERLVAWHAWMDEALLLRSHIKVRAHLSITLSCFELP